MWGYFLLWMSLTALARGDRGVSSVVHSCNQFSLDLLEKIESQDRNVFFSPFSICACLAMVLLGSRGDSASQLKSTFHYYSQQNISSVYQTLLTDYSNLKNSEYTLTTANGIYMAKNLKLKSNFKNEVQKYFNATLRQVDFAKGKAEDIINRWVTKKTQGKINKLFQKDSLGKDTKIVIANGIYFKGIWRYKFLKRLNTEEKFKVSERKSKKVTMMTITSVFYYEENSDLNAKTLEIPYRGNRLSMLIILPNADFGLSDVLKKLKDKHLQKKGYISQVLVKLPKFQVESNFELKKALKELGVTDLFTNVANLSAISDEPLKISDIQHKAFVQVDETGTEAAAVTGVIGHVRSFSEPIIMHFYCDHPFYFAIIDQISRLVLFSGIMKNPKEIT